MLAQTKLRAPHRLYRGMLLIPVAFPAIRRATLRHLNQVFSILLICSMILTPVGRVTLSTPPATPIGTPSQGAGSASLLTQAQLKAAKASQAPLLGNTGKAVAGPRTGAGDQPLGWDIRDERQGGCNPAELPQTGNCDNSGNAGNSSSSVDTATGNFVYISSDVSVPDRSNGLAFKRTYNALKADSRSGPLGYGWTFNYNMTAGGGLFYRWVYQENGSAAIFDAAYGPPARVLASWDDGGIFTRKHGQETFYFNVLTAYRDYNLSQIVDRNGYTTTVGYEGSNGSGRMQVVTDTVGNTLHLYYDDPVNTSSITRVLDPGSRNTYFGYDSVDNLTVVTDVNGLATHYTYYSDHRLHTITDPNGNVSTNAYDGTGRLISQTTPAGRTLQYEYTGDPSAGNASTTMTDTLGIVTVHKYVSGNRLSQVVENASAPSAQQAVWQYNHNDSNCPEWVSSVTDPISHTWSYTRDTSGNLLTETDPLSRTTSYTYNATNDLTAIVNARGVTTTLLYDAHRNLTSISHPVTETSQVVTNTYSYDSVHPGDLLTFTNALGNSWKYAYDSYGYVASVTNPLTQTTRFTHDTIGRLKTVTSPLNYTTTLSYNAYGDPTTLVDSLGYTTTYQYYPDRTLRWATDAGGHTVSYYYNADQQPLTITVPGGISTYYGYDAGGRLVTQTNGLSQSTRYGYDGLYRVISVTDPLTHTTQFNYDLADNLTVLTNAMALTTTYGYDNADELLNIHYHDGGVTPNVSYGYNNLGMRSTMTDGIGTTSYVYDSLDRLSSVKDGYSKAVTYTYDLGSRLTGITYPYNGSSVRTVSRGYDNDNRLTSVQDWLSNATQFGYNSNGDLTTMTYPNGVTSTFGYDAAGQVLTMTHSVTSTTFLQFTYQYDPMGLLSAGNGGSSG